MRVEIRPCLDCGRGMVPATVWRRRLPALTGYRSHGGRGLCKACHNRRRYRDELLDIERLTRSADDMLDDWALLRGEGYTVRQAAERMGVTFDALDQALTRAKRRGDSRGGRRAFGRDVA